MHEEHSFRTPSRTDIPVRLPPPSLLPAFLARRCAKLVGGVLRTFAKTPRMSAHAQGEGILRTLTSVKQRPAEKLKKVLRKWNR